MTPAVPTPEALAANQPLRFYKGGERIRAFRRGAAAGDHHPEDWIGSSTMLFGDMELGLTRLRNGEFLRDAVARDPLRWLGQTHVDRHGLTSSILVKLLDAGERLPVHAHPDRTFARSELDSPYGKAESWVILEASVDASIYLGFREPVPLATLARWVAQQDTEAMLGALNRLRVRPGDGVFVPAGLPHAIGEGILLLEAQEPTDLSVLLEWKGFEVDGRRDGHLGIGYERALSCVVRSAVTATDLARLVVPARQHPVGVTPALPPEASDYFRVDRVRVESRLQLTPSYGVLVITKGAGSLEGDRFGALRLIAGVTVVLPFAAGPMQISGKLDGYVVRPPA